MMTVKGLKRKQVLCGSHRDLKSQQAKGLWLGISPRAAAETALVLARLDPLSDREKKLFSGDTGR